MKPFARKTFATALTLATVALMAAPALALAPKEARDQLDLLVTIDPSLRVVEVNVDATGFNGPLPGTQAMRDFRAAHGEAWRFTVDLRRGVTSLLDGGAIPIIPGLANGLAWEDFAPGCSSYDCLPVATVEALARDFIDANSEALGLRSADLVLNPAGSGPFGGNLYFLRFDWLVGGLAVDHATVYVRINSGNLIQLATERVGTSTLDAQPTLTAADANLILQDYLGPFGGYDDNVLDAGSLRVVPVTPAGQDPDVFDGSIGSGIDYRLAWRFAFTRKDVIGTWEGLVDAHTGELLRFVDTNEYGRIHGGAYPGDNHTGEADRPFPFADTGLPAPNQYADAGGLFPGDNATTHLLGKYARLYDACGTINNTTTTGDVDFSLGGGTDCAVPSGNTGGPGNTHSARTQYYHLTSANLRAQAWLPNNTWLQNSHITVYTNGSPWCNATGGGDLNFYKAAAGCWNLGEIPGVALHEWGHTLDNYDGSTENRPVEGYADWMAALHLHDSCVGRGFFLSGNCSGYGDPCTNCGGIRDMDYMMHAGHTPWSAANYGTLWQDSGSGYYGPCGIGSHAESGIPSQALWDFANRKLTGPPHNLDERTAWLVADRLWYLVIPTLGYDMYTCTIPSSNGCGGSSLFNVMRAIDDDGDGTANGTPRAGAIFSALADHNIACGTASDPSNQNQTSCPSLGAPTVTGEGQNNSAVLTWTAVVDAARYAIYRSDIGCDAGLTRIAIVDSPTLTYTDTTVVNDIDYYYMVQALGTNDACFGLVSNCATVTPVPCFSPDPPTGLAADAAGDNQINLTWTSSDPLADTFSIYRAVGACPQSAYELIASGVTTLNYLDTTASGGLTYSYVVTAKDVTGGCESAQSNCAQAQTTGTCFEPPAFAGLESVTNAALSTCTLDLAWSSATAYCGGPATYSVYRSTTSGFTPSAINLIESDVSGTTYSDVLALEFGTTYYYVVRATDGSTGVQEDNLVEVSSSPTGPIDIGTWVDDAGDTGTAQLAPTTPWTVATTGGHNAPKVYATGSYPDNLCAGITSDEMHLGAGPALTFWSKYSLESGWDKGEVQVSTDGGTTWVRVPVNYPASSGYQSDACGLPTGTFFTGTNNNYAEYSASLATWANQDIMIRWALSTDTSVNGSGWWVDDIAITNVEVPSSCEGGASPFVFGDGFESGDTSAWSATLP
jgi:fibronectin type 3 domain-containing protein